MKKILFITLLIAGLFAFQNQKAFAQAFSFAQGNLTYTENFDAMGAAGTTYLTGWTAVRFAGTGAYGATLTMAVTDGSANSGNVYNVGTIDAPDRAMGTLASGSTIPRFGAFFLNNTGATITQIDLSGVMEQWRAATNSSVNEVVKFKYSLDATDLLTGTWDSLATMDFVEIQTGTTTSAALDGNLPANQANLTGTITNITWAPNTTLWISWTDNNDSGSDGLYAIDNFSMTVTTSGSFTPDPEPTNYPNTFTATPQSTSITLDWTDATGEQLPAGYLIKASTADDITAPVDATPVSDDLDLSDGIGAKNIAQGIQTYTFSGLQTNTKYYFSIYPYTNSGQYIDFKVDGTAPSADTTTLSIISSQDFGNGLDPWIAYSVSGDQVWTLDTLHGVGGSKCMKMTGYAGGSSFDNEDWLISSPINLSNYINTSLSFQTAMNYGADTTTWFSVLVSTDYAGSGDPNNFTWTPLTATLSPGGWAWTSSGAIDISSLSGHTFYLAFKYICNTVNARTWEVDDVVVFGKQQSNGINDPGLQADAINIYPNPVKDNFTISLPEKGLSTLTLLNATGKQILQLQNLRGLTTVNTSDLPKGLYLITVQNNTLTNSITKKIVVR